MTTLCVYVWYMCGVFIKSSENRHSEGVMIFKAAKDRIIYRKIYWHHITIDEQHKCTAIVSPPQSHKITSWITKWSPQTLQIESNQGIKASRQHQKGAWLSSTKSMPSLPAHQPDQTNSFAPRSVHAQPAAVHSHINNTTIIHTVCLTARNLVTQQSRALARACSRTIVPIHQDTLCSTSLTPPHVPRETRF